MERHIGVMVHARQDDLVALLEFLAEASREMERQARHVLPEHDLVD